MKQQQSDDQPIKPRKFETIISDFDSLNDRQSHLIEQLSAKLNAINSPSESSSGLSDPKSATPVCVITSLEKQVIRLDHNTNLLCSLLDKFEVLV